MNAQTATAVCALLPPTIEECAGFGKPIGAAYVSGRTRDGIFKTVEYPIYERDSLNIGSEQWCSVTVSAVYFGGS